MRSNGGKIVERVSRMRTEIEKELATLDRKLAALEAARILSALPEAIDEPVLPEPGTSDNALSVTPREKGR